MDKLKHAEGLWKALHDKMDKDHHRSMFVMSENNYHLLRLYYQMHVSQEYPVSQDAVSEGWHELHNWEVLVKSGAESVVRVKY